MDYRADIETLAAASAKARDQKPEWLYREGLTCGQNFAAHMVGSALMPGMNAQVARELALFAYMWAVGGYPRVVIDHKLAASFMATSIPSDFCDGVRLPWNDFVLSVPSGLLAKDERWILVRKATVDGAYGARIRVSAPYNGYDGDEAHCLACGAWREFADAEPKLDEAVPERLTMERILQVCMRLLFSVCVELDRRSSGSSGGDAANKRGGPLPTTNVIRLSRPVNLDARTFVREYLRGDRSSLRVQFTVRGHWKNQPHGPGASERKFIHIEPYWRGPEDAPIAVRPHILKTPKKPDGDGGKDGTKGK